MNASDRRPITKTTYLGQVEAGDFGAAQPGAECLTWCRVAPPEASEKKNSRASELL